MAPTRASARWLRHPPPDGTKLVHRLAAYVAPV